MIGRVYHGALACEHNQINPDRTVTWFPAKLDIPAHKP
jgi:hypothetical protein